MQKRRLLTGSAIAGILTISTTIASAVPNQPSEWEKCAGVAKVGMNDCGALDGKHACAGQSKMTNSDQEWIYVPKGTCDKIPGGMVVAVKPAKK